MADASRERAALVFKHSQTDWELFPFLPCMAECVEPGTPGDTTTESRANGASSSEPGPLSAKGGVRVP